MFDEFKFKQGDIVGHKAKQISAMPLLILGRIIYESTSTNTQEKMYRVRGDGTNVIDYHEEELELLMED